MAKYSLFWIVLLVASLWGNGRQSDRNGKLPGDDNATETKKRDAVAGEPVVVEDRSGLTKEQISDKAKRFDKEKKRLKIKDVVESIDENGTVEVTKLLKNRSFAPSPRDGYDWIRTKYGDWLIGHIRSLYKKELEFDSKEFGIYRFKFKDIVEMKSYAPMQVNIDNVAIFKGVIRYKEGKITIIGGEHTYTFDKDMIISITSAQERELHRWVGDFSLNVDFREGNIQQENIVFKGNLERRTPQSRLGMELLERFTKVAGQTTANDNRLNFKYDIFYTKKLFFAPVVAEFYSNQFQNIEKQYTVGLGVGYTIFDDSVVKWEVAAGPAYLYTRYIASDSDRPHEESFSFEAYMKYEYKFNAVNKVKTDYRLTLTERRSGGYKHHVDITLENDIVKDRIFIDTSFIWDYIDTPQFADGTAPLKSDYQLTAGGGLRF